MINGKEFKNTYKDKIQIKKYEMTQKQFERVDGDQKGTWRVLNNILNDNDEYINEISDGDIIYSDDKIIANQFNKYFIDTIDEIHSNIPDPVDVQVLVESRQFPNFKIDNISVSELKRHVNEMQKRTARDMFDISVNILSDAMFYIGHGNDQRVVRNGRLPLATKTVNYCSYPEDQWYEKN